MNCMTLTMKKWTKRILCSVLAAVLCLSLCSCSLIGAIIKEKITHEDPFESEEGDINVPDLPIVFESNVQDEEKTSALYCSHPSTEWQVSTNATCTESGEKELICLTCGEVLERETIAPAHSFDSGKCTVCGEKDPNYVVALEEITVSAVDKVTHNVPALSVKEYSVKNAEILVYNGNISKSGQVDSYTHTVKTTGRIRVEIDEIYAGNNFELYVLDKLGEVVSKDIYCVNGDGLTLDVKKGESYTIRVCQDRGYSSYRMIIGQQKPTLDLTSYTKVKDSVEFTDQCNVYTFTPAISGRYRFEVADMQNDINMEMYAYDRLGERIGSDLYFVNEDGLTLDLTKGQTYTLEIHQDRNFGSYTLKVGNQKETVIVNDYNEIKDSMEFTDQVNIYTFTAPRAGVYNLGISGMQSGVSCDLKIYDELGATVAGDGYYVNGDNRKLTELQEGKTYTICLTQQDAFGAYTLSIGVQKETVAVSSFCKISDSMQFAAQTNNYSLVTDAEGTHVLEISGMNASSAVGVYVYNTLGEVVAKDTYCVNEAVLELGELPVGTELTVSVSAEVGLGSYVLSIK